MFVLLVGDLGSHHSAVSEKVFAASRLPIPSPPFVVINDQDARGAPFTLLSRTRPCLARPNRRQRHTQSRQPTAPRKDRDSRNDVAGEFLLPGCCPQGFDSIRSPGDKDEVVRAVRSIANAWSVSEPMVAYRLHRLGCQPRSSRAHLQVRRKVDHAKARKGAAGNGGAARPHHTSADSSSASFIVVVRTLRDNRHSPIPKRPNSRRETGARRPLLRTSNKPRSVLDYRG